jgi:hypothetical protein
VSLLRKSDTISKTNPERALSASLIGALSARIDAREAPLYGADHAPRGPVRIGRSAAPGPRGDCETLRWRVAGGSGRAFSFPLAEEKKNQAKD